MLILHTTKRVGSFKRAWTSPWDQQSLNEGQENAYHKLFKGIEKSPNQTESHQAGPSTGASHQYMHKWQQAPESNTPFEILAGKVW